MKVEMSLEEFARLLAATVALDQRWPWLKQQDWLTLIAQVEDGNIVLRMD